MGLFIFIALALAAMALAAARGASRHAEELTVRIATLEAELRRLREERGNASRKSDEPAPARGPILQTPASSSATAVPEAAKPAAPPPIPSPEIPPLSPLSPANSPMHSLAEAQARSKEPLSGRSSSESHATPPPPLMPPRPPEPSSLEKIKGALDWEQFMGAKLFAWIGGLALFLGVAYFVKYSFDNNLIPPEARAALGFLFSLGLVAGGVFLRKKQYAITAQTLCATGVVSLYGVTFACRAVYHFPLFSPALTFGLMCLITAGAFLLAARMDAQVVAILGMLGGFLAPILVSTGQDAPLTLFSYIALLDAGLLAVALRKRWDYLSPLAAAGTVFMLAGWGNKFFVSGEYAEGGKTLIPMSFLILFNAMWIAATRFWRPRSERNFAVSGSALGLAAAALGFSFYFLDFQAIAHRPWLLFSFMFLIDAGVFIVTRLDQRTEPAQAVAGGVVFLLLALWLGRWAALGMLAAALVFTLVFAALHSLAPLYLWSRERQEGGAPKWALIFPPISLAVLLVPLLKLTGTLLGFWPVILLINLIVLALAAWFASVLVLGVMLALTMAALLAVLTGIPADLSGLPTLLILLGAFSAFFIGASLWLRKRLPQPDESGKPSIEAFLAEHLPSVAAITPFLLLLIIIASLPLWNPTPVFALGLLLVGTLLALAWKYQLATLPIVALGCAMLLQGAWHSARFRTDAASLALIWNLVFYATFSAFPFVFARRFVSLKGPWIAGALAGPLEFLLVHDVVKRAWPNDWMGALAAAFAIPVLIGLRAVAKLSPLENPARLTQLAFYGGAGLLFITLIFPLQFDRQWLTVSWAMEGAALCWLFHRVPHPGLRLTGVALLAAAFARLALNPAVLIYYERSALPILNWYLYTYGIVIAAFFAAARLLAPPRNRVLSSNVLPALYTMATILAFLLLNIQIADFFLAPGEPRLVFQFSGNFARDMTYSIAWALFALALLIVGLIRGLKPVRYAALGLLGATVLKLFFHDLARLAQLYRIGALMGVAVIAIVASFLYQRFAGKIGKTSGAEQAG